LKIVYCGDIVGKSGRDAVLENIYNIRNKYKPDVFIINGENSAHGFGITPNIADMFFDKGIDAIVTGNHAFNKKEVIPYMDKCKKIIRPLNFPDANPGRGFCEIELLDGKKILIAQIQGILFMEPNDNPLTTIDKLLSSYILGKNINAIFIDIHAEITSEKLAVAHYLDGRVSAVIGTHTHVPTADARILKKGTAYQTDVGMCGDYDSVIGFDAKEPINRVLYRESHGKLVLSEGKGSLCGVFIETDNKTGLAAKIEQIIIHPDEY
jgi:metallophosphoesterase (TIGR00282 family)